MASSSSAWKPGGIASNVCLRLKNGDVLKVKTMTTRKRSSLTMLLETLPRELQRSYDIEIALFMIVLQQVHFLKRDSIIFAVDYRVRAKAFPVFPLNFMIKEPMHEIDPESGESFFQLALRLIAKVIKGKIIFQEDDYIGVCFFGTVTFGRTSLFFIRLAGSGQK